MGLELLFFINSGRIKLYKQDGSREYRETLFELERARVWYRPNQTMNFYVDPQEGHDDFLVSLALVVQAARGLSPREAKGWLRESLAGLEIQKPKIKVQNNRAKIKDFAF